ncbi:MAG: helix-turn-helix domain-containing protein [Ruminococcaceae bacterium]|nr:helix-turn-helix domain-containing protein [Oscillospiraceae bacterium]
MQNDVKFFVETFQSINNPALKLAQFGYDKCAPSASFSHFRDFYMIHIIVGGMGTITIDDNIYHLKKGDAFCVRPNEILIQNADKENPWELFFFAFGGSMTDKLFQKTVFNHSHYCTLKDDTIYLLLKEILEEIQLNDYTEITCLNYLLKLLTYFESHENQPAISKPKIFKSSNKDISEWIKDYINTNYAKPIKVSDIAKQLNINRSHLYRIFKSQNEINIETYIRITRIHQACHLLKTTNFSANVIASLVGYNYYPNFFKHFKEDIGTTPTKYRKG